jgi:hypothetical protein
MGASAREDSMAKRSASLGFMSGVMKSGLSTLATATSLVALLDCLDPMLDTRSHRSSRNTSLELGLLVCLLSVFVSLAKCSLLVRRFNAFAKKFGRKGSVSANLRGSEAKEAQRRW